MLRVKVQFFILEPSAVQDVQLQERKQQQNKIKMAYFFITTPCHHFFFLGFGKTNMPRELYSVENGWACVRL